MPGYTLLLSAEITRKVLAGEGACANAAIEVLCGNRIRVVLRGSK